MVRYDGEGDAFDLAIAGALTFKSLLLARTGKAELALATVADLRRRSGDSTEPDVRAAVEKAIALKAKWDVRLDRPEDALSTIELADGLAASAGSSELQWLEWTKARALLIQGNRERALDTLAAAYGNTTFDEGAPGRLLDHVPELIGCGLSERDLLTVFGKTNRESHGSAP